MPGSNLHALVVFNDRSIADTFLLGLHQIGVVATAAYRCETAAALARSLNPDVLIIDSRLGEMNGMALAVQITSELPDCEVVLFSTKPAAGLVVDSETANLHIKLLMKPVHPQDVLDHLEGLAARLAA